MYLLKTEKDKTCLFFTKTFFTWNMAGRLCFCGSLVMCVIVLHFSGKPCMPARQVSLQFLEAHKCVTQVKVYFSSFWTTKPSCMPTSRMAASLMFVLAARLINVTLAANLVLMANNVSSNPGPGSAPPAKAYEFIIISTAYVTS